jgi:hypothetical protein
MSSNSHSSASVFEATAAPIGLGLYWLTLVALSAWMIWGLFSVTTFFAALLLSPLAVMLGFACAPIVSGMALIAGFAIAAALHLLVGFWRLLNRIAV